MKDKFTMSLVWHNCKTYPPKEDWNNNLYISDGIYVTAASYDSPDNWYDKVADEPIPKRDLSEYWWADVDQTIRSSLEFMDAQNTDIDRPLWSYDALHLLSPPNIGNFELKIGGFLIKSADNGNTSMIYVGEDNNESNIS